MNLSASDVQRTRFRGTRHAYDRREVDAFLQRVVATLASHEAALVGANHELAAMKKTLQQLTAARDAARRRPEIRAASHDDGAQPPEEAGAGEVVLLHEDEALASSEDVPPEAYEGEGVEDGAGTDRALEEPTDRAEPEGDDEADDDRERLDWLVQWIAAHEASAAAAEIIAGAHEERRMIASIAQELRHDLLEQAEQEAAAAAAKAATAAKRKATRLVNKAQKEAEAARAEAEQARAAAAATHAEAEQARAEAAQTHAEAEQTRAEVEQTRAEAEVEVDEMKQRLSRLQESLAEAKDRIGHLSDATATDVAAISDLVALDSGTPGSGAEPGHISLVVESADATAEELRDRLASLRRQLDEEG